MLPRPPPVRCFCPRVPLLLPTHPVLIEYLMSKLGVFSDFFPPTLLIDFDDRNLHV